jgi:iron complex outermembrane receptor protein
MLGAAAVRDFGPLTTKLRASYGKSIRPAGSAVRASWIARDAVVRGSLAPEEQSGIEAGFDASIGRSFSLRATRFDQTAYNLIQPVAITSSLMPAPNDGRLLYALQNVGEISNRGWELESALAAGPLSLTGTLSLVDSRVRRLASGYSGDLAPGDRMLGVPARTFGLTTAWTAARWSTSLTLTRAADWMNYDGLALATASVTQPTIVGERLRSYWRSYSGVTHIDASFSRQLFSGVALMLNARNLLDAQRGEPDNITVLPGRTISVGLQAKF